MRRLLELEAAIGARAARERRGRPARGARVAAEIDVDARELAKVSAQDRRDRGQVGLLDQEVRARASTLAGAAGRTADERGDALRQTARAQRLHLLDRAADRGHERNTIEQRFGLGYVHRRSS